jgi:hypothetical protein
MATARPNIPADDQHDETVFHTLQSQQASPARFNNHGSKPSSHISPPRPAYSQDDFYLSTPTRNGSRPNGYPMMFDPNTQLLGMAYDRYTDLEYLDPAGSGPAGIAMPVSIEPISMTDHLNQQLGPTLTGAQILSPMDSVFSVNSSSQPQPGTARYVSSSEFPNNDKDRGWIARSPSIAGSASGMGMGFGALLGDLQGDRDIFDWQDGGEIVDASKRGEGGETGKRQSPGSNLGMRVVPGLGMKRGRAVGKRFTGANIETKLDVHK